MKLSNLLLFAGSAVGSYLLVKNRQAITEEVLDTTDRVEAIKDDLDIIQDSLQIIDQQKELIKEYQKDLTYKFKVLEKDVQTRLAVLKELQETAGNCRKLKKTKEKKISNFPYSPLKPFWVSRS